MSFENDVDAPDGADAHTHGRLSAKDVRLARVKLAQEMLSLIERDLGRDTSPAVQRILARATNALYVLQAALAAKALRW